MYLSDDFIERWENLIQEIEVTTIPIECIAKILLKLEGRRQKTINVTKLVKDGLSYEDVEDYVNTTMIELDDEITSMKFTLDVERVAEMVQPLTDKLLEKL